MITLRPYQEKALDELRQALRSVRAAILCQPCGSGKGTLIAYMVNAAVARGKKVIFAVHGRALVHDMSERVARLGIEHGVLMGGKRRELWQPVQVASIDTLHRMENRPVADLIILDEARTFLSPTGRLVLDEYPSARLVGMDATPTRLDGKGLGVDAGGIFETMVMGPSEQDLIDLGFLVPSVVLGVEQPPDVSKVSKTGGDFNQKALALVCDKAKLVGDIVEHWLKHARDRKTVSFGVDQAHAKHICEQFQAAGVEWEYVDADTPDDERADIWNRLDNGTLMGVSNCGICLVGWDHPVVSCLICARPTTSLALWRQMIGRGSRIHPGKKNFLIIDHAGNTVRLWPHGFFETPPIWTLEGAGKRGAAEDKALAVTTCKTPRLVSEEGVPDSFTGELSPDSKWLLPCFAVFRAGPETCPYCGMPLKTGPRKLEVEAGNLQDLSALRETARLEAKQGPNETKMRLRFLELARLGAVLRKRNGEPYSQFWPAMAFKSEFHRWPTKAWKDEARAITEGTHAL